MPATCTRHINAHASQVYCNRYAWRNREATRYPFTPRNLRWRQGRIFIYGCGVRNQRPPTLVLAFYQHGLEIHQFFHPPFSEEKNERTFSSPACWSVRPTVCSPKEGDVRVSHPYACSWVRTSILAFCHSFTNLSPRVDVDLDIPAIAAIGWQSAGKSSLIEAISGIKLPRASGTCTR